MSRGGWVATAALVVLALVHHPFWIDAEDARRGLALTLAGVLALAAPAAMLGRPTPLPRLWWLLFLWQLVAWILAGAGDAGVLDALWALPLLAALLAGRHLTLPDVALAAAAATLAVVVAAGLAALEVLTPPTTFATLSTLANRNTATEVVAVAATLAAAAVGARALSDRRGIALLLLTVAASWVFLAVQPAGARTALGAAGVGLLIVLITARRRALPVVLVAVLGGGCGWLFGPPDGGRGPAPAGPGPIAFDESGKVPSTLRVRLEIWRACGAMVADAPLTGQGPGGFVVEYPRYRTEEEIDRSTYGRSFAASPATAHNDHVEVAVEAGLPGLLLWVLFWGQALATAWRHAPWPWVAPVLAFLALACFRAPATNAPAAIPLFLMLGALEGPLPLVPGPTLGRWLVRGLGILAVVVGIRVVVGHTFAAGAVALQAESGEVTEGMAAPLERAIAWWDNDPRFHHLLAQTTGGPRARRAMDAALALRPHDPGLLIDAAVQLAPDDPERARERLAHQRRVDPHHPAGQLAHASLTFHERAPGRVVAILWDDPHERLRADLESHFSSFWAEAMSRGWSEDAGRYHAEVAILRAADEVAAAVAEGEREEALRRANETVPRMMEACRKAGILGDDRRPWLLAAALQATLGVADTRTALTLERTRARVAAIDDDLTPSQAQVLAPALAPLRGRQEWRALLPPR